MRELARAAFERFVSYQEYRYREGARRFQIYNTALKTQPY